MGIRDAFDVPVRPGSRSDDLHVLLDDTAVFDKLRKGPLELDGVKVGPYSHPAVLQVAQDAQRLGFRDSVRPPQLEDILFGRLRAALVLHAAPVDDGIPVAVQEDEVAVHEWRKCSHRVHPSHAAARIDRARAGETVGVLDIFLDADPRI